MNAVPAGPQEANFDGLVGPTHHNARLARGSLASTRHPEPPSNPREAALQGLAKMRAMADLGLAQGVLPPQERPFLPALRARGLSGRDADVLCRAWRDAPALLSEVSSASSMWAANAATVSPSADTADGRVHFTPANLVSHSHRALETATTARVLRALFRDPTQFAHHAPLPADVAHADQGAANQLRIGAEHGQPGLEVFVYGGAGRAGAQGGYPSRAAGEAIARQHGLAPRRTLHLQQDPRAIAAGAFHNDRVAVANRTLVLYHAHAFIDPSALQTAAVRVLENDRAPVFLRVTDAELSLEEAVTSSLFNSQLVDVPGQTGMWLICARDCEEQPRAWRLIQRWIQDPDVPIGGVRVLDLHPSLRHGGGPASLRLRVVLTAEQRAAVHAPCWFTPDLHAQLDTWVRRHYRDRLLPQDLADPALLDQGYRALDELTQILRLGSFYEFQR